MLYSKHKVNDTSVQPFSERDDDYKFKGIAET